MQIKKKICKICNKLKDVKKFGLFKKSSNNKHYIQPYCKVCVTVKSKNWKIKNKKRYALYCKEYKYTYIIKNQQEMINLLKTSKCRDCGSKDIRVLEFDHLENKKHNISSMMNQYGWSAILKEIKKCEIVCANCHRIRTAKQFGHYKSL